MRLVVYFVSIVFSMLGEFSLSSKQAEDYIQPPLPQGELYPLLLHEHDVIRLTDIHNQPVKVGGGTYADVTLAELRGREGPDKFVVIKSFKDSSFGTIMREVRIHRFIEHLNVTPRLIGLLPNGPLTANISLVYEYLPFSNTIAHWLKVEPSLTVHQWLDASIQLTAIFQRLHSLDVIYNDLHTKNIMIQTRGDDDVSVKIIDFGFSTYKQGKPYFDFYGSLYYYSYLAPEVKDHTITSKKTDIYSMGNILHSIALVIKDLKLVKLSLQCMRPRPQDRVDLETVMVKLKSLAFEYWLRCLTISTKNQLNQKSCYERYYIYDNKNSYKTSNSKVGESRKADGVKYNTNRGKINSKDEIWAWAEENLSGVSSKCPHRISVLDKHDVLQDIQVMKESEKGTIAFSLLKSNKQYIILKDFETSQFKNIRQEACNTAILSQIGIVPKFIGLLFSKSKLTKASIVQEFFGFGTTLNDFVLKTVYFEWDRRFLFQSVMRTDLKIEEDIYQCYFPRKDIFEEIIYDLFLKRKQCEKFSERQVILESLARKLTSSLIAVHSQGFVLNNLNAHNVVVKSDFSTKTFDAKIIDVGQASRPNRHRLNHGYEYLSSFSHLAPEVKLGYSSSFDSDRYSLCYMLSFVLNDYLSDGHRRFWMSKTEYEKRLSDQTNYFNKWYEKGVCSSKYKDNCGHCKLNYFCKPKRNSISDDVDNHLCNYMQLDQTLHLCLHGRSVCRPSLYSILKILKRMNS